MVKIVKLHKQSNTRKINITGGVDSSKYFIQCKDVEHINDWLRNASVLNYSTERAIVTALLDDTRFQKQMNVIVKISQSSTIDKEYAIAEKIKTARIPGFILFICKLQCNDNLQRYNNNPRGVQLCSGQSEDVQNLLVMPYISGGSMRAYAWESHSPKQLVSCLTQLVLSLASAFQQIGLLHSDIHLDNVLLRHTRKKTILYDTYGEVATEGLQVVIMDFDKSFIGVDKKHTAEFYKDIQKIFFELMYTMRLNFTNQEIINSFLNSKIFSNSPPLEDVNLLIQYINGIVSVNKKSAPSLTYNPNPFA
jgi:hypothetical protein